jgi:hypothetical protein
MNLPDIDTDRIDAVITTVSGTVGDVTEAVADAMATTVVPAAATGARRTARSMREHPRLGLGVLAFLLVGLVLVVRARRRRSDAHLMASSDTRSNQVKGFAAA